MGKIWRKSPPFVRRLAVRLTQTSFTVSVGAIVTNDEGKVLLLDHVLRPASGWGIPGGFINEDEQPVDAVKREICEEIGLQIENVELIRAHTVRHHIEILFRARARGKGTVKSREIREVKWFALDEMPEEMSRGQKRVIRQVLGTEVRSCE